MLAIRESDGVTIGFVLSLSEAGERKQPPGHIECRDPACPDWGDVVVDFWRHFHPETRACP